MHNFSQQLGNRPPSTLRVLLVDCIRFKWEILSVVVASLTVTAIETRRSTQKVNYAIVEHSRALSL